ncbi:M23 family metallopeptidase [Glycomyces tarimensis]
MSDPGPAEEMTIRRHAARPHRVRGQHRASWAAELSQLIDGTQRRYTAVVGTAVAASSVVAMAATAGLPSGEPDPAASEAVADIAALAEETSQAEATAGEAQGAEPEAGSHGAEAEAPAAAAAVPDEVEPERDSPVIVQPAEIEWTPMLDEVNITSLFGPRWGRNHNGIDFAAATGTPVYAVSPGTVAHAGWESGFGNLVIIDHGDGVETLYAHNSEVYVAEGQWVDAGTHIADAGNTGFSLGPHLHFEVHVDGQPVEPIGYLESAGLELR